MGFRDWFRRVLGRALVARVSPNPDDARGVGRAGACTDLGSGPSGEVREPLTPERRAQLEGVLAALEAGPPRDVHDRIAWDEYWKNQISLGAIEQSFNDSMASDAMLVGLLNRRGARTILCAGNGLSTEAVALALHGFDVTAVDISAVPQEAFVGCFRNPEHPSHRIPGFAVRDDSSVIFGPPGPIDPELCPPMHRSDNQPCKGGGSLSFVIGDLMNEDVCPGPFDVVIERRTLQLFPNVERNSALDRLVARLADRGVFVSHQHQGGWHPRNARKHYAEKCLKSRGFVVRYETTSNESDATVRLACLTFSTG